MHLQLHYRVQILLESDQVIVLTASSSQRSAVLDECRQVLVYFFCYSSQLQVRPPVDLAYLASDPPNSLGENIEVPLRCENGVVRPGLVRVDIDDSVEEGHEQLGVVDGSQV